MALFRQQHINIIRDALPVCVKRQGLEIKEFPAAARKPEGWMVHFDCTLCWQPRDSVKTRYKGTIHETAAALAAAIERKHPDCQHTTVDTAAALPAKRSLQDAEGDLVLATKRLKKVDTAQAELQRKVDAAAADQAQLKKDHGIERKAAKRRAIPISADNKQRFTNVSYAMREAEKTSVEACMRYWCMGSAVKLLQIVMAIINTFGIQQQVLDKLQGPATKQQQTEHHIVQRLSVVAAELKDCNSEEARQDYRKLLTFIAPEKKKKGDNTGMKKKVADAIGVSRKSVPYADAIKLRVTIDATIKSNEAPLAVGDTVSCSHGVGKLISMPADYPTKDGKCAVEITHVDLTNISEFDSMRGGVDGGRVRRPAISFAHAARQHRKDATSDDVKLKVQRQHECGI